MGTNVNVLVSGKLFLCEEETGIVALDGTCLPKLQALLSKAQEKEEPISVHLEGKAVLITDNAFFYELPIDGRLREDLALLKEQVEGGVIALSRPPLEILDALREAAEESEEVWPAELGDVLEFYFGVVTPAGYLLAVFLPYHWEIPPVVAPIPIGEKAAPSEPLSSEVEGVR